MASIKFLLGMLPDTAVLEAKENQLRKDYEAFRSFEKSDDLKHFEQLQAEVNSSAFKQKVKEIKSQKFKDTPEYKVETEYFRIKKSKPITTYYKVLNSDGLREFESFTKSTELKRYNELKEYIHSDAYIKEKASLKPSEYKNSEPGLREKEYKSASKSALIKRYFKFEKSAHYAIFMRINGSEELKKFNELEKQISSDDFLKVKKYMNLSPKEKFESSPEYKKLAEYELLKKSEKITWYYRTKKKYPFSKLDKWELRFEENFESNKLDNTKWTTRHTNADKTLKSNYVLADDRHAFTDGKNIEFFDKKLRILTKREASKSLVWNPQLGFYEKNFDFTSGMITTGEKYVQKYGLFEAKVKIAPSSVTQSLSLITDSILPHLDIFKLEGSKIQSGVFWKNGSSEGFNKSISKVSAARFTRDFFIYTIEWIPGKITWKINGEVFKVQTQGVPDQALSILFNSSLKDNSGETGIPSAMEIDWIRVFDLKA
jgi:hypothetical protein